jgi:hypothetical protein
MWSHENWLHLKEVFDHDERGKEQRQARPNSSTKQLRGWNNNYRGTIVSESLETQAGV